MNMFTTVTAFLSLSLLPSVSGYYQSTGYSCYFAWRTGPYCGAIVYRRLQSEGTGEDLEGTLEDVLATGEILNVSQELWVMSLEHFAERGVSSRQDLEKLVFKETREDTTNGLLEEVVLVASIWDSLSGSVDANNDGEITVQEWDLAILNNWEGVPIPTTPEVYKSLFKLGENNGTSAIFADFFLANLFSGTEETQGSLSAPFPEGQEAPLSEGLEAPEAPFFEGLEAPLP